jgi:putative FmdB family regulatory protein
MPFYEYQCKNCGHDLEAMQKVNDPPLKKCPECGKSQLTRLMSAPVFRLKGAGWYETDFKGDQDNKKNLADRPEAEAAKDDAKPAADAKAGDATAKDAPAKEASGKDAGGKESKDAAKPADKAADKPVKAAPTESSKKPAGGTMSKRGASAPARPAAKKTVAKKAVRKPAPKARRRG